jgi:hypothetical protein
MKKMRIIGNHSFFCQNIVETQQEKPSALLNNEVLIRGKGYTPFIYKVDIDGPAPEG